MVYLTFAVIEKVISTRKACLDMIVVKAFINKGDPNGCTTWQYLYWKKLFNAIIVERKT